MSRRAPLGDTSADLLDVSHDLDPAALTLDDLTFHTSRSKQPGAAVVAAAPRRSTRTSRPSVGGGVAGGAPRPSWGPPSSALGSQAKREKGKMRFLQGLEDDWAGSLRGSLSKGGEEPDVDVNHDGGERDGTAAAGGAGAAVGESPVAGAGAGPRRGLGGMQAGSGRGAKPRYSLFAKPAYAPPSFDSTGKQQSAAAAVSSPSSSLSSVAAAAARAAALTEGKGKGNSDDVFAASSTTQNYASATGKDALGRSNGHDAAAGESKEQVARQLAEVKVMNDTFESYERMLLGATDQIDTFADRIDDTNKLLDIYIDLLRQSEKTQTLLTDPEWKGATDDAAAHVAALQATAAETARIEAESAEAARQAEALRQATLVKAAAEADARRRAEEGGAAAGRTGTRGGATSRGVSRGAAPRRGASSSAAGAGVTRGVAASSSIARGRPSRATGAPARGSGIARGRLTSSTTAGRSSPSASSSSAVAGQRPSSSATQHARTASSSTGASERYAGVRSSGYGPR
ncbi:hypothetical protein K437DRAFT_275177 [Tilletiaria anomala UBC 951]|uniref:DASH complex subunit DUO1 n=1 Tax=Tilletiaria anomala (strain ATCC 24038 / CBS 436.72 / UBC 951) TaxID=1037660 RepID=A0A066VV51_TILAU|nr:uncharacterized protein K437DRAFT_275177 [Tilletiaria anomala UBC 951]KDN42410.1 hypothetical protein K437DRAFT_275177 [Tilletiaria anomala UBC 951]